AITRYEIQPASGVKVSKITTLSDDIALNLAALGVRIEAPIPGRSAVGVEIPNKIVSMVTVREIIESDEFINNENILSVVLGKDISGKPVVTDLSKMPHLLIAGSTGAGKSVCVNSFIISLLYKASPEDVKILMIDPKVVELGVYNDIPHLLVPVVTDPRKSAGALNWAVNEMLNRYKIFAEIGVRDITSYNSFLIKNKNNEELNKMAKIVIIIDELSDLMIAAPSEIENYICRLTQMARAAGIHLVIATQRPSVDVITGIIKANVPSRIALAVSSQVDSRTILDMGGAEKLLGRGDMLFSPVGSIKPMRVQGCYVTETEIERVVRYVKGNSEFEYDKEVAEGIERGAENGLEALQISSSDDDKDSMISEAIKCVIESGQASTSLLQRKLRVGYARAGRLVDEMEKMGIVGPHEGSKPRKVIMTYKEFLEKSINN
ncbi:MAG: DNA translocase FtsK, partial [Firmicutes bacterium]|nr:DNA translocase FtsK [Bacillota bacterium]